MERHKENMEGNKIICGRFVKVMVQGAQAVSKGSDSWVLCESCIWCCIKEQLKWPYLVVVYSQFSVINYKSPTKFLIRKQSAYPNYLFLSP